MKIVRMQNAAERAEQTGSALVMPPTSHYQIGWLDSPDQHVADRTDGDGLDQVAGRWSQPVKVEIPVNELMRSANHRPWLDCLGPLLARAHVLCPCVEPRPCFSASGPAKAAFLTAYFLDFCPTFQRIFKGCKFAVGTPGGAPSAEGLRHQQTEEVDPGNHV